MKIKKGFELRDICGEKVIMATGIENVDFNQMIALNESAAYLWQSITDKDFDANTLATLLCENYEVSEQEALNDAHSIIKEWLELSSTVATPTKNQPAYTWNRANSPSKCWVDAQDTSIFLMHLMVGNLFANLRLQQAFLLLLHSNTFRQLVLRSEYL